MDNIVLCILACAFFVAEVSSQNVSSEFYDIFNTGKAEWRLAFRGTAGCGKSVYEAYASSRNAATNVEPGCIELFSDKPCHHHYRNNDALDKWGNIEEVAFVVYQNTWNVHYIVFDGVSSDYKNWYSSSRIKVSTWSNLKQEPHNFFSIDGDPGLYRRFFLNRNYGGCPADAGWFVAIDVPHGPCPWEVDDVYPVFKYSSTNSSANWTNGEFASAQMFAVFLKYNNNAIVG